LSYLLHDDDHVPAKTSRAPFIVAGLILASVAGFFYLRGSSQTDAVAGSGIGRRYCFAGNSTGGHGWCSF